MKGLSFFFVMLVFLQTSYGCDQVLKDLHGKEIRKSEDVLKFFSKTTPLILWLKAEKKLGEVVIFSVKEVVKGFYPGKSWGTDSFILDTKKIDQTFNKHEKLESRLSRNPDCSFPQIKVGLGSSYLYFVGVEFEHMLEQIESKEDKVYKIVVQSR